MLTLVGKCVKVLKPLHRPYFLFLFLFRNPQGGGPKSYSSLKFLVFIVRKIIFELAYKIKIYLLPCLDAITNS
jgi:hypothetical protein